MKYLSLVTGGAGFIGSNLVERLLNKKHKVIVIDNFSTGRKSNLKKNKNLRIINCDIANYTEIEKYFKNVDFVFHMAGLADIVPSIESPEKYFKSNVVGTFNVLHASNKFRIKKFIYAASASCYGFPEKFPTNELSKIQPMYPYALTKWQGEELVKHFNKIYKLPTISLRFFNIYGPKSRTSGTYGAVFGVFLAQKIAKKPLTIVGSGNQTRDFLHVSDLITLILKSAYSKITGEIYNVAGGKEIKVNKIAKLIGGKTVFIPKRPGEPDRSLADIRKVKKDFNWSPKISIEKGVKDLLNKIDYWKSAPVWTPSKINKATKIWFDLLKKK
jgi:UDP-glucose 4-epimerase